MVQEVIAREMGEIKWAKFGGPTLSLGH